MEQIKWLFNFIKTDLGAFVIGALVLLIWFTVPKLWNRSENATQEQFSMMKIELAECKTNGANKDHINDSLRQVIQKQADQRIEDLQRQNEVLERTKNKYQDALIKTRQVTQTIDNIQKKVNNEIK